VLSITPAIGALLALAIAPAARAISLRDGAGSREASR
jgi:hypothetical protein